jgi:hypothetical protein
VKEAWAKSFVRVETNWNAVLHQGWGPKFLNMNVLLHSVIVATKHLTSKNSSKTFNGPSSLLLPLELNISEGLAGTLVDRIVFESNREAATRGSNVAEITKKWKETVAKKLENHKKHCTAGLLASAGRLSLGEDVLEHQRHSKEIEEENTIHSIWHILNGSSSIRMRNPDPYKLNFNVEFGPYVELLKIVVPINY